ncbi:hypothetical protein LSH36_48g01002 [Paralvinella palmiformis]|uniref:Ig-like domain-containing protein n=1 Tax=Paralvinella palmiformis TaxID=53620 RepID=A0AAD9K6Q5_9ANNE|nr:hypothetical protein LSH36_48g01002 [Paralvinella palmiformis]
MAPIMFISILLTCLAAAPIAMQPADIGSREMNMSAVAARSLVTSASDGQEAFYTYTMDSVGDAHTDEALLLPEDASMRDACLFICSCDSIKKRVDCSSRRLNKIPQILPEDVQYLDLSQNNISQIADADLMSLSNLLSLDLSHNELHQLPLAVFSKNHYLEILLVRDNHLENIDIFGPDPKSAGMKLSNASRSEDPTVKPEVCNVTNLQLLDLADNNLSSLPSGFLDIFPNLKSLVLDENNLGELPNIFAHQVHTLQYLSINGNYIQRFNCTSLWPLTQLQVADFGNNWLVQLPKRMCSKELESLKTLTLSGNPLIALSPGAFMNMTSLNSLHLMHLNGLRYLPKHAFTGLVNLRSLNISHSPNLRFIHKEAFKGLHTLETLDISYCNISWMGEELVENTTFTLILEGNPWHCDCDLIWLTQWLKQKQKQNWDRQPTLVCHQPSNLLGHSLLNDTIVSSMVCEAPDVVELNTTLWFKIASSAVIDCLNSGHAKTKVTWITPKKQIFVYDPKHQDFYNSDPDRSSYHVGHYWHKDRSYHDITEWENRIAILYNGSLYLDYVTRLDAGNYTCLVNSGHLNETVIIGVRLNYAVLSWLKLYTIIWGFICAFTFFFLTMVVTVIRYYAFKCSSEERRKRKSIREVLDSLQDFKTIQIDRLCAYKTAKINKFSAFKTDKMHKLVAFKTAKIDKLRTYKQVTVASVFHHLEKMREHYNFQMNRVKDNCTQQAEKLRENYSSQMGRIKGYKSEKIDLIRDNYSSQVLKIKEYRAFQMNKLREQYKLQQQHLLKLMELLDIGNCLTIVEAECMRTESMIFDPNISIDLEAEPVHVQRDMDLSDVESEYVTAGSQSDLSVSDTMITTNTLPPHYSQNYSRDGGRPTKLSLKPKHNAKKKQASNNKHTRHRVSTCSDTSSDRSSPSHFSVQIIPEPLPAPPAFTYNAGELNEVQLEQLVDSMESDMFSVYQMTPSSAHYDQDASTADGPSTRNMQARNSVTDSTSTAYDTAEQSREQSPQPSDADCGQGISGGQTAKDVLPSETIV